MEIPLMKNTSTFVGLLMLAFAVGASNTLAQTTSAARMVVSPYYQADNASYTFIGISHPSLAAAVSQIGLKISAVGANPVGNNYLEFTISAGGTKRIFIVISNHSVLNPTTLSDSNTLFITVASGNTSSGLIEAISSNIYPTTGNANGDANNLAQLSFWGAVVAQATNSGFAMEFIGDAHDSLAKSDVTDLTQPGGTNSLGFGRGIN